MTSIVRLSKVIVIAGIGLWIVPEACTSTV